MTRPAKSSLVLDGSEVKVRLLAERTASKSVVHVDWVRFTCLLRNAPVPSVDDLFPKVQGGEPSTANIWEKSFTKVDDLRRALAALPDADFATSVQAKDLAVEVAEALGPDYTVAAEVRKGHDFYRFRWSIERNGIECGWVGYLSSSDSPQQQAQARGIHCNLFGAACTFADIGWNHRLASIIEGRKGDLTRCDLALDFFDGVPGMPDYLSQLVTDYKNGLCDSGGKRLKCNMVGDWANGNSRSFYVGSKQAGKETNVYEKGDQLFGPEAGSCWIRAELRYGNKLRELRTEMLRRPADFFAGASEWHASLLMLSEQKFCPEPVKTTGRLALETVEAEVVRNVRWLRDVAAPTCAAAIEFLGFEELVAMIKDQKLPGRLQKFSLPEIRRAFMPAFNRISTVAGTGPAFA
ncbi:replication initiation factor domain-containing protein [Comamonas endophytica]|uniref:Replication initiation factor domain-containing protein n=1 Tax=Comamonas endophytica TaxID=2949090 RepID=A0ABY6G9S0_9BURK|nr:MULTISPECIES: replication initiation factor domain-containing protein [unclassified Acidovorax]MCD2514565.1 replication initiation factor domain-containing protein [Acidovorax sp. D4N7]UYG51142.1 replication initiation factor domain-containing protein [Acidovorax sp. 5MLIR]